MARLRTPRLPTVAQGELMQEARVKGSISLLGRGHMMHRSLRVCLRRGWLTWSDAHRAYVLGAAGRAFFDT